MKNMLKRAVIFILQFQAKQVLKKYNPKIIAVTGSVGKTSTKDAIFSVLSPSRYVRKSEKSFNSDIGVPLTILGCNNAWSNPFAWLAIFVRGLSLVFTKNSYPDWLVLEIGADSLDPTYMTRISTWLRPDVSVFTTFAKVPVHVEFFGSRENLFKEKTAIFYALKREGVAVFNYDDEDIRIFAQGLENKKIFFGNEGGEVKASNYKMLFEKKSKNIFPIGISFDVGIAGVPLTIELFGSLGKHHVYPALAAIAVGHTQGLIPSDIKLALKNHTSPHGRMYLIDGMKGSLIIDDTYNSSPVATIEALSTLHSIRTAKRRIAILGDMMELGLQSSEAHKDIGVKASSSCDILVTVGVRSRKVAEAALDGGLSEKNIYQFDEAQEAGAFMQNVITQGDVMLIKGSQSMRMERTVKELMLEPEKAGELLVRQEEEWETR